MKNLPRSTPEKQGVKSQAIIDFLNAIEKNNQELHSFMLVKNGHVISECWWEPYKAHYPHQVYSIAKSLTSTGIGMAVDEGLLTVDTLVADIFKKELDELDGRYDEKIKKMTVKHLMTMTTGMEYDAWEWNDNNIKNFLSSHIRHEPGSKVCYHSFLPAYMESAIITRLTGQTLYEYLKPRLFEPLDINAEWPDIGGVTYGCNYIELTTEEIAKFGQLYLQRGNWNGKQLISEKWIDEATKNGYHFGKCEPDGVYMASGFLGQHCIVLPNENSVIAITSTTDGDVLFNLLWDILLPALRENNAPNDDVADYQKMKEMQKNLSHLKINETSEPFPTFKSEYKICDEKNIYKDVEKVYIEFNDDECILALHYNHSEIASLLRIKNKEWLETISALHGFGYNGYGYRTHTLGEWQTGENEDIFTIAHWHPEAYGKDIITIKFNEDKSKIALQFYGNIYSTPDPTVYGIYVKII